MSPHTHATPPPIKRQAVVIIHGIGEQRPLGTLKSFVRSFRPEGTFYSKPERLTGSFEARRMKLRKLRDGDFEEEKNASVENWIETDFYEYYWAHMMFGTRWRHFLTWAGRVLSRVWRATGPADRESERLHNERVRRSRTWVVVFLGALLLVVAALFTMFGLFAVAGIGLLLLGLLALDWLSDSILLRVLGDVSRYLDVAPRNIARRHAILKGGIDLLQSLHSERSDLTPGEKEDAPYVYDRIVVVGHSLGSVIGYELIKHYWFRVNRYLTFSSHDIPASVTTIEKASDHAGNYADLQFDVWRDLGRAKEADRELLRHALVPPRWLVTDFVTLGSPLTYGAILMADSAKDFAAQTRLRELPTCPPNRSLRDRPHGFAVHLWHEATGHEHDSTTLILHHAAPFALTRWTNFFYEKDPVGGPLRNIFGAAIRDIPVDPATVLEGQDRLNGLELHTRYWPPFPGHIPELNRILSWLPGAEAS